jgi:hypothetical protein
VASCSAIPRDRIALTGRQLDDSPRCQGVGLRASTAISGLPLGSCAMSGVPEHDLRLPVAES